MRAEIKTLQRRTRTTTLYVTHDQVEAMTLGDRVAVLNHGVLQQVAPPRELYDRPGERVRRGLHRQPADEPVSDPAGDGRGTARVPRSAIRPRRAGDRPAARVGTPRTGGIRPEAITLAGDDRAAIRATVAHVELLGHETLVHADVGDVRLVMRTDGMAALAPGDRIGFRIDPARVHFFDDAQTS